MAGVLNANWQTILTIVESQGYLFIADFFDPTICSQLEQEANSLNLEFADHVSNPINLGTVQEVHQSHERSYHFLDSVEVPICSKLCYTLAQQVADCNGTFPALTDWIPTEIGYQRYHRPKDWISPHRDRKSDRLLSVTLTITGSAWMRIYKSEVDPPDYSKLIQIDEFLTKPGTAMFLRAPGFGSGQQIIHEVMPPLSSERLIVNLRMRSTILKAPKERATYDVS